VSCAPLACTPLTPEITMPGKRNVRIGVSAATNKSALAAPAGKPALEAFEKLAAKEAATANEALSHVATAIATVALTADACAALSLAIPLCVPALTRGSTSGAALNGIRSHEVPTSGRPLEPRAMELHYQEQARAKLDKPARIEICVVRDGYTRACTTIDGRPLAATPMAEVHKSMSLRRGISGTLSGSFVMTQSDGADCKFSPSPRTSGALTLSFDDKTGVVSGTLSASERGARNGLRCSLGSGDMRWTQSYSARMSQTFDKQRLQAGGALTLRLVGTMTGSGQSTQSNCRSSGGASVGCPAGRNESYNYPIELNGSIDLDTQIGTGRLQISNAPLSTSGTWRVPGEKKATP
jgi:hypothetical protein